jgi:predicted metalloprotease with PDZ domain
MQRQENTLNQLRTQVNARTQRPHNPWQDDRRATRPIYLLAVAFAIWIGSAGAATADAPAPIAYTITFPARAEHYSDITATFPTGGQPSIDAMMAIWSPGFYRVEDYASRVQDISARAPDGTVLRVTRPRKNRWRIETPGVATVTLSYRLVCTGQSVTTNWVGADYAVLNGPATFITLAEKKSRPHEVTLRLPTDWKRSVNAMDPAADGVSDHYRAPDFDTLADSPIIVGTPETFAFEVDEHKHSLVCIGDLRKWDGPRAARDLEKVVRGNKQLWGFLPYKSYRFLLAFRRGGGGLEHKDSTLMTTNPSTMQSTDGYLRWLSFATHEYFHAYNVKRLRPIELGPFDYEHEPHTTGLWVSEGLTNYYADLIPCRVGVFERADYLSRLSSYIRQLQSSPGRLVQSLEQASLDVWTSSFSGVGNSPKTISYYVKGPVVGFLLDARIRRATNGSKSLDNVMRLAYQRYAGERGFTAQQFRQTAEEVAGTSLKDWYDKAIASATELDYSEALNWFGLRFAGQGGNAWKLETLPEATAAQRQHFDEWLAVVTR